MPGVTGCEYAVGDLTYLDDREMAVETGVRLVRFGDIDKTPLLARDFPVVGLAQGEDAFSQLPEIMPVSP